MANIKSAQKRIKVIKAKTMYNQIIKSQLKTCIKKFEALIEQGKPDEARDAYKLAVKKLDQAAAKGIVHKNTSSRKKAKLTLKLNRA